MESIATKDLMARASAAARVGEALQARSVRRGLQKNPENAEAWLGLAGVIDNPDDKKAVLEQALRVDPENTEANAGLERSRGVCRCRAGAMTLSRRPTLTCPPFCNAPCSSWISSQRRAQAAPPPAATEEVLYCVNHPDTETLLRCNKCGRPVCTRCVQLTDVGYRCKDCISNQQKVYFNAEKLDYPIAFAVGFIVCAFAAPISGILLSRLGLFGWIIAILAGSAAGGFLAEIVRRAVGRRRGRHLWAVAFAGILLGVLVGSLAASRIENSFSLFSIANLLFLGLALSTTYYRLR
ncbi:MAG: hypothetical protein HZY76_22620 [Anaerolineae bacterium]|nr:MAG: hypothetical protein HZY76_22620 [Anaerolineae bacterium]